MYDLGPMTDKFSEAAQKVIYRAIEVSKSHNHNWLYVEHIFAALSDVENALFTETLVSRGIDPRGLLDLLNQELAKKNQYVGNKMYIADTTRDLLNRALKRARSQGRQQIEPYDLLDTLFTNQTGTPADILRFLGLDPLYATEALSPKVSSREESKTSRMIFISYRRQDSDDITGRIYDRLVQHFGKETIFKDVNSIPLGVDFRKFLGDAVGQCNLLLVIIGRQWLTSENESGERRLDDPRDFVRIEIEAALQRGVPVIPLLVQGTSLPGEKNLPSSIQELAYRNAISIRTDPDFHYDIDRLIKGIELHFKK